MDSSEANNQDLLDSFLNERSEEDWLADIAKRSEIAEQSAIAYASKLRPKSLTAIATQRIEEKLIERTAPSTGYFDLDSLIKGFLPGHLYILTGQTNSGKTQAACNFTERVRLQGKRILYFALEPENTLVDYLASVRLNKRFDELTHEDISFDDGMIHVYGKDDIPTLDSLVKAIENAEDTYDLIIIDHIGYFIKSQDNHIQEQSNAVKILVGLAKKKRTAIMAIAHLRKAPPGRSNANPTMDDISGSAAFKQDATEVLIVVRYIDEQDEKKLRYTQYGSLFVAKTKAGQNGSIDLIFSLGKANITSESEVHHGRRYERVVDEVPEKAQEEVKETLF